MINSLRNREQRWWLLVTLNFKLCHMCRYSMIFFLFALGFSLLYHANIPAIRMLLNHKDIDINLSCDLYGEPITAAYKPFFFFFPS